MDSSLDVSTEMAKLTFTKIIFYVKFIFIVVFFLSFRVSLKALLWFFKKPSNVVMAAHSRLGLVAIQTDKCPTYYLTVYVYIYLHSVLDASHHWSRLFRHNNLRAWGRMTLSVYSNDLNSFICLKHGIQKMASYYIDHMFLSVVCSVTFSICFQFLHFKTNIIDLVDYNITHSLSFLRVLFPAGFEYVAITTLSCVPALVTRFHFPLREQQRICNNFGVFFILLLLTSLRTRVPTYKYIRINSKFLNAFANVLCLPKHVKTHQNILVVCADPKHYGRLWLQKYIYCTYLETSLINHSQQVQYFLGRPPFNKFINSLHLPKIYYFLHVCCLNTANESDDTMAASSNAGTQLMVVMATYFRPGMVAIQSGKCPTTWLWVVLSPLTTGRPAAGKLYSFSVPARRPFFVFYCRSSADKQTAHLIESGYHRLWTFATLKVLQMRCCSLKGDWNLGTNAGTQLKVFTFLAKTHNYYSKTINILRLLGMEKIVYILLKRQRNFRAGMKRIKKSLIETRLEAAEDLWIDFKTNHKEIVANTSREQRNKEEYFRSDIYEQFQEQYLSYKALLKDVYHIYTTTDSQSKPTVSSKSECNEIIRLPRIELPSFSGKYNEWQTFYDMFSSVIHQNASLPSVQKLHYLKSCLSGEPEQLIRNFSTTDANYNEAWEQLLKRYNNKKYNCNSIMQTLFSLKPIQVESATALKTLLDTTSSCLKSLNNIGVKTDTWDAIIVYMVVSKLDQETHKQWEYQISVMSEELPTWTQLAEFLDMRFRSLEMIEGSKTHNKNASQNSKQILKTKAFNAVVQEDKKNNNACPCCNGSHHICHCKQFGSKSVQDRYNLVQSKRLCFNCLGFAHSVKNCKQNTNCRKCGRRHHSLLHATKEQGGATSNTIPNTTMTTQQFTAEERAVPTTLDTHIVANFSRNDQNYNVLLATAMVKARSRNGIGFTIRALLDQGSQASFVTESTVQLLGLKRTPISGLVSGLGDGQVRIKYMVSLVLESIHNPNNIIKVNAYVLSVLPTAIPNREIPSPMWVPLEEIKLADPTYMNPGKIDVLLGAEVYCDILLNGVMKHPQGHLLAQNTILGWIISGRVSQEVTTPNVISLHVQTRVDDLLKQFWEVENEPPSIKKKMTIDEKRCEELYESTTVRARDGRYIVRLPFNSDNPECQYGEHKIIAEKRLKYLERKLEKKPKLYQDYRNVIEEYLELGHMKSVDKEHLENPKAVYLPHHAVVREDKLTTKVRVVFDASCKGVNNVALNDNLLVGPKLQQDLRHLLMRWRTHKICIIADVVKMYRQVRVANEDIDYQRILWRIKPNQEMHHYNLLTLTFGTACAPYLAVKSLQRLADDEQNNYPIAAEITKNDYYMDDLMTGCDSDSEAIQIYEEMNKLMKSGGFELQKWSSNNHKLLEYIGTDKHLPSNSVAIQQDKKEKVLGLCWNKETDNFEYSINLPEIKGKFTKRQVLSDIARLYDPMGWIAPVVIVAKLFTQKLWKSGLDWDDDLDEDLSTEWIKYRKELEHIKNICIPRWLNFSPGYRMELHAFADASMSAYAGCVYLRVIDKNSVVFVNLLTAKTKVAPIEKEMSVPRLELSGAVIATKLLSEVAEVMNIPKDNQYAWTDSTVVLAWLKGPACKWTTFVSNRVSVILTMTDYEQWGHVATHMNPSDCASRGLKPSDLAEHSLWWHGPIWLNEIRVQKEKFAVIDTHEEEKIKTLFTLQQPDKLDKPWERFSSFTRMLKVLSYYIRHLKTRGSVPKKSVLHPLCPIFDKDGILRVGGRIDLSGANYDTRHPIIMPGKHHFTKLIIADAHSKTMHGGPQLMLNHLRCNYWIIRARELVKKHYRECVTCIKMLRANKTPFMGQIPAARLKPSKPFKSCGVDFAGPINFHFKNIYIHSSL
ncbi:hypothetical protein K1T71_005276 [Dendrolimus kikuchii]|uniref:Uncharacterized protein n=1 Tax=Dendrolimus kikuchii TaxID=765133 RepID=A0ACC1D6N3_9NEOP|nr:hypothetical protein K1T71_005276 [Dendrolimus kikuchii]